MVKKNKKKLKRRKKKAKVVLGKKELIFKTKPEWSRNALVNKSEYEKKYEKSIKNNDEFWKKAGKRITWIKQYNKIKNVKYSKEDVKIKWYEDGTLNASANCIDRHLKKNKDNPRKAWRSINLNTITSLKIGGIEWVK